MPSTEETHRRLTEIPNLPVWQNEPLSRHTRFGIGGPARYLAESDREEAILAAVRAAREAGMEYVVLGGGTNIVADDSGFDGLVLRYTAGGIRAEGNVVRVEAGAELDRLVEFTVQRGLGGLETLAGIPGSAGAAVYGNAGAYGHSISEAVRSVRFFDGERVRELDRTECRFGYRESIFKHRREWVIFTVRLELTAGDPARLKETAARTRAGRDRKFPPALRCAGSIFKNLQLSELPAAAAAAIPPAVVREGKAPAAYFLEQIGAKGRRRGGVRVADFHANIIYNEGGGTAKELRDLITELKAAVRERFGLELEEEVQFIGFPESGNSRSG